MNMDMDMDMNNDDITYNKRSCDNDNYDANGKEMMRDFQLRKGKWTEEEDSKLIDYVGVHGEAAGGWNSLARRSGLRRSGKSCRLRWLNYLRPDVVRGNLTLEEQFLILHLHCLWGNRWSKIAKHLPGRTDNEVKNYWRTRIQKQGQLLNFQPNSQEFRDTIRYVWLPRLLEKIQTDSSSAAASPPVARVVDDYAYPSFSSSSATRTTTPMISSSSSSSDHHHHDFYYYNAAACGSSPTNNYCLETPVLTASSNVYNNRGSHTILTTCDQVPTTNLVGSDKDLLVVFPVSPEYLTNTCDDYLLGHNSPIRSITDAQNFGHGQ